MKSVLFLSFVLMIFTHWGDAVEVNIPDANLEHVLREKLGISSNPLAERDLATLTSLSVIHIEVTNLTGLEHCTALQHLGLIGVNLSDLHPIAKLENLKWLDLGNNQISDVRPLEKLVNLHHLRLDNNHIRDIQPLVNNPSLGQGDSISVASNPLNTAAVNNHLPTLKTRGVNFSED